MRSLRRAAPHALPSARAVTHRRSWSGCISTTRAAPRLSAHRPPLCPEIEASLDETGRAALHRRGLSWKKAKRLLGRANPERRQAFVEQIQDLLAGAQRDRHLLVYLDEAHIHQDADLGYGWAERGRRF